MAANSSPGWAIHQVLGQADVYSKTLIKKTDRKTDRPHEEQGEEGSKEGRRKNLGGGAGVQLSGRVFS